MGFFVLHPMTWDFLATLVVEAEFPSVKGTSTPTLVGLTLYRPSMQASIHSCKADDIKSLYASHLSPMALHVMCQMPNANTSNVGVVS